MKKNVPGFVPVNFKFVGRGLLAIALFCLLAKLFSYLTNWFSLPNYLIYICIILLIISLYLIFIVPEE